MFKDCWCTLENAITKYIIFILHWIKTIEHLATIYFYNSNTFSGKRGNTLQYKVTLTLLIFNFTFRHAKVYYTNSSIIHMISQTLDFKVVGVLSTSVNCKWGRVAAPWANVTALEMHFEKRFFYLLQFIHLYDK